MTRSVPGSEKRVGVGLGLALAREVVLAHRGTIRLTPSERGAMFEIVLPIGLALADQARRPAERAS